MLWVGRDAYSKLVFAVVIGSGCYATKQTEPPAPEPPPVVVPPPVPPKPPEVRNTCAGPYPSFWSDPSNTPPADAPHVFRLSQAFPKTLPEIDARPWREADPFKPELTLEQKRDESRRYLQAVIGYILEGNVTDPPAESDFDLCQNPVRPWFHVPWMDANPSKGREYVHGMTRELSASPQKLGPDQKNSEASWAVGFYNARGGYVIGQVFAGTSASDVTVPQQNLKFPEGTVVGKALFTTAAVAAVPNLAGAPKWRANILPPPCGGRVGGTATAPDGSTVQCTRTIHELSLAQFDVAVVDERAPLKWTFGTFLFDAKSGSGWKGLSPVGLMWGNDSGLEPVGTKPDANDPAQRGLTPPEKVKQSYMFTADLPEWFRKDLGCAGRLDGPIDNPRSSCMSCHASASVPLVVEAQQKNPCSGRTVTNSTVVRAPILGDFNKQCGDAAIDKVWFRDIPQGTPVTAPEICSGTEWVSLDYSLQLGEALANFLGTQAPPAAAAALRTIAPSGPTTAKAKALHQSSDDDVRR